jgi:BirA family biotin operon repressor/biotin-[acetyl-CoA-carboxylase] ligase
MNEREFKTALRDLPLGGFRFYETTGSTNDEALAWAVDGAPDFSLIYAEEQLKGRGRLSRKWYTPRGSALAVSLILKPTPAESRTIGLFTALGALALMDVLKSYKLDAQIKWPNDVLINRRKVAGVLAESVWAGERIESVVLGIGVNVRVDAVPFAELINFPATSIEGETRTTIDRPKLLRDLVAQLIAWRAQLGHEEFIRAWNDALAFRGEEVIVRDPQDRELRGIVEGVENDGGLRLKTAADQWTTVRFGEVQLRPAAL